VHRELSTAINEYLPLYNAEMRDSAPKLKTDRAAGRVFFLGPSFVIGNVPEGKVMIVGTRLKVLALVWVSGILGLNGCQDQVERVARLGVKQRTDLYDDPTLDATFKAEMLRMASLYNRQIISSGLLGLKTHRDHEALILKAAGAEWRERKLAVYTAVLTEFDLLVRSGGRRPDYSRGSLTVKFVSPMNDASFDSLLKELHLIP